MTGVDGANSGSWRTTCPAEPRTRAARPAPGRRARHTLALPPEPSSPARARGLLRRALDETDRLDCLDAAELACTELVTNAVLHAHTTVVVTVEVGADVRVEVRDGNGTLPLRRHYDPQATTGRGLALVAALTDDYGIDDVGPDGKTVWFTVGGPGRARTEEELLGAWDPDAWDLPRPDLLPQPPAGHPVRLLGLPSALWLAARQHHDALLRELALYRARHDDVDVDLVATDRARSLVSSAVAAAVEQQRREAFPAGGRAPVAGSLPWAPRPVDLDLVVPAGAGARDFAAMQDTLDTAEQLARAGQLLASPGLPEIVAVRDWACEQVVAQVAGIAPAPWPGTDLERYTHETHRRADAALDAMDLAGVSASAGRVAAADESNRLVAVSEPLARMLGWRTEDLVGQRIVALVPHRLREAHVAGFTRHQSTGEAHILGAPVTVPVLRADGGEVTCHLVIEHVPLASGRGAYLARFEPLAPADAAPDPGHD